MSSFKTQNPPKSAFSFRNSQRQITQITANKRQDMDQRFSKYETGVAIKSTRGLLLSKPYEPHYPLSTTSSKINGIKREGSFAIY